MAVQPSDEAGAARVVANAAVTVVRAASCWHCRARSSLVANMTCDDRNVVGLALPSALLIKEV
ncbi:hypothetical protein MGAST_03970 [Mycobacterium gastri 'Wayne']|uniref:Uncharacterized protein n=1 Tax=Mycobacterium gastri TaxID=1777 RepID=A0A1X1VV84_MYCGS|nr:hypothetical protein MGAST_03970 [Mycobacterium gastri 'Wayne']ORV72899.1 hypothetical protein AWC07_03180 [Mycobacterium gastri]